MTMPKLPDPLWTASGQRPYGDAWSKSQVLEYGKSCYDAATAAERERYAKICDKEADDATSSKRKPFLTEYGKALYDGMAGAACNCASAIRGQPAPEARTKAPELPASDPAP